MVTKIRICHCTLPMQPSPFKLTKINPLALKIKLINYTLIIIEEIELRGHYCKLPLSQFEPFLSIHSTAATRGPVPVAARSKA